KLRVVRMAMAFSWIFSLVDSGCLLRAAYLGSHVFFFFSSRRRHTRSTRDWSSDVCSSDLRDGKEVQGTLVSAVVEGLNIQNIVTADWAVARLTSEHPRKDSPPDELSMLPIGSYFVNLRIAGTPVTLTPHDELLKEDAATRSQMEQKCRKHLVDPDTAQGSP